MTWEIKISKEARKDYQQFDKGTLKQIFAGIIKVSQNPLPHPDGYGKPLGNKQGNNLMGFFKIKYKGIGIRVIYTLVIEKHVMNILVISERKDEFCYTLAAKMYAKYGMDVFQDVFDKL